jgi:hypothetical protein
MAAQFTSQPVCQSNHSWFASEDQIGSLCSTILTGLGVFGLAASGMCPSTPAQIAPSVLEDETPGGNGATGMSSPASLSFISRRARMC